MTFNSLLPYNATKFERSVEESIKYTVVPEILAGFKFKTVGYNINLSLSWEYSLAQINIDDFKERVIQGLKFHRIRGTPEALRMAFSWWGYNNIKIEEEPPGKHFAEFQIGVESIPNDFDFEKTIEISKLAAPLRSRFSRMYNDLYDIRRFILDSSSWGDLLSDYSGYRPYEGSPKFSFGRINSFVATTPTVNSFQCQDRVHWSFAANMDRPLLDWMILDDGFVGVPNYRMGRMSISYHFNKDYIGDKIPAQVLRNRSQARALIILDEYATLGDVNCCFSLGGEEYAEEPFMLCFSFLSEQPTLRERVLYTYREINWRGCFARDDFEHKAERGRNKRDHTFVVRAGITATNHINRESSATTVRYAGNNCWTDQRHFSLPWNEQRNCLGRING